MAKITYVNTAYRSFEANVPDDLVGKEGYVVEVVAGSTKIQIYQAGIPIGVLQERLEGSAAWNVRMFGKGGTLRGVSGGAINAPAYVKPAAGGTMTAAGSADKCCGVALLPLVAAAGDVIEVIDNPQIMP
jgi:hypothetical protein